MQRFAWFLSLALILFLAGGGCNSKLKEITKERDALGKSVQELKEENDDLKIRYGKAKQEKVRLQGRVEKLSVENAAGKCAIDGIPEWNFKDREFLVMCEGKVKNTGTVPVSNVTIMIIFKDANKETLKLRYSNGQPTRPGIFCVMSSERMNQGDVSDFTVTIFTRDLRGDDFSAIKDAISAGGDRVEIKPLFIQ